MNGKKTVNWLLSFMMAFSTMLSDVTVYAEGEEITEEPVIEEVTEAEETAEPEVTEVITEEEEGEIPEEPEVAEIPEVEKEPEEFTIDQDEMMNRSMIWKWNQTKIILKMNCLRMNGQTMKLTQQMRRMKKQNYLQKHLHRRFNILFQTKKLRLPGL